MLYTFIIRRANADDAPAVFSILKRAFTEYSHITGQSDLEALKETVEDIKNEIETKAVYIAVIDNEILGTVRLDISGDQAFLSRFAVDSRNRNKGIGKSLMSVVDKYLKEKGVKKVTLYTSSKHCVLMRFYYGRGFYVEAIETDRGYLRARLVKEY
ncbi:MAG: GNAT family N-acetyltransferase [Clostridiaceae bacterium]|jgi:predicted N-acetyltransferase YhbS|nr:GNAT family N-acetyltransferase [Clostridiaceae bacterium]